MEMSITRALAELKLLDKKIEKAIQQNTFVSTAIGKNAVKNFKTTEEFENAAKAAYQSVLALIKRRQDIKSAIVKSNAATSVTIAGEEMTVAEAIDQKTSIIHKQNFLRKISLDFHQAHDRVETENLRVKHRLDEHLKSYFENDTKGKNDEIELISNAFLQKNEAKVVDPINARVEIDKLQESIENFLSEVDFILSESNTITKIVIAD